MCKLAIPKKTQTIGVVKDVKLSYHAGIKEGKKQKKLFTYPSLQLGELGFLRIVSLELWQGVIDEGVRDTFVRNFDFSYVHHLNFVTKKTLRSIPRRNASDLPQKIANYLAICHSKVTNSTRTHYVGH